jgi:hypothetical protein
MSETEKQTPNYFYLQGIGLAIALLGLIITLIWLYNTPSLEKLITVITLLLAIIGFLGYFATNHRSFVFRPNKNSLIQAKLIEQYSEERKNAFAELRSGIKQGDQIWVLGTGVTSFLEASSDLEAYLNNGARIQILMFNNDLLKTNRTCQGNEGVKKILDTINSKIKPNDNLGEQFLCDIQNCHFLIQQQHFNHYYKRSNYHEKIIKSQEIVQETKKLIREKNWPGSIEAKKFTTFFPLSVTVVNPNSQDDMKMIIEFVLPFTDQRLMLQYPQNKENKQLYQIFVNFFSDTWNNHSTEI